MVMDICNVIGKNVATIRHNNGWSQEELAFRSGLHRTYISGIERGHRNPTLTVLQRLSEALNVEASDLVTQQEQVTKTLSPQTV